MILSVGSDAAYLVASSAKSYVTGFSYFPHSPNRTVLKEINSPIHVEFQYLCHVVASAVEAEVRGLFHN